MYISNSVGHWFIIMVSAKEVLNRGKKISIMQRSSTPLKSGPSMSWLVIHGNYFMSILSIFLDNVS